MSRGGIIYTTEMGKCYKLGLPPPLLLCWLVNISQHTSGHSNRSTTRIGKLRLRQFIELVTELEKNSVKQCVRENKSEQVLFPLPGRRRETQYVMAVEDYTGIWPMHAACLG